MKQKIYLFFILISSLVLGASCNKEELLVPADGKLIKLNISGSTLVDLEVLYGDKVIGEVSVFKASSTSISLPTALSITDPTTLLTIRKKGTNQVLYQQAIKTNQFQQNIKINTDGNRLFNDVSSLSIRGFAGADVEFYVNGAPVATKNTQVSLNLSLPGEAGGTNLIEIRKKGDPTVLLSQNVPFVKNPPQLKFLYDGVQMVKKIDLAAPVDKANMVVKANYFSIYPDFWNKKDVDVVFYTKTASTDAVKTNPEIRLTLPANGTFNSIELPPPPTGAFYSFDLVEKGTNSSPYTSEPLPRDGFPLKPNLGRFGRIDFQAGRSKVLFFRELGFTLSTPENLKGTYYSANVVDLSTYFY